MLNLNSLMAAGGGRVEGALVEAALVCSMLIWKGKGLGAKGEEILLSGLPGMLLFIILWYSECQEGKRGGEGVGFWVWIIKLSRSYTSMAEQLGKTGRELNATFLPASLLRKTENKLASSLASKCKSPPRQTNLKRPPATPS